MAFVLGVEHKDNGWTHITVDVGPTDRVNLVAPTGVAHETLAIPMDHLLGYTFSEQRPPQKRA